MYNKSRGTDGSFTPRESERKGVDGSSTQAK